MKEKNLQQPSSSAGRPRPSPIQVWRQIGVILLGLGIWAGLFVVYLSLTGGRQTPAPQSPQPTKGAAPTLAPSEAATPTGVPTTVQPTEVAAPTLAPTEAATPTGVPATVQPATASPIPPAQGETPVVSFARDVLPLLQVRCERCHSNSRAQHGFSVSDYGSLMAGSQHGPVITPGSSATSLLVELILSGEMPRGAPRLSDSEIEIIRAWIDQGALDN